MPATNTKRVKEGGDEGVGRDSKTRRVQVEEDSPSFLSGQGGESRVTLMIEGNKKRRKWVGYLSDRRRDVKKYGKRWVGERDPIPDGEPESGMDDKQELGGEGMVYGFGMLVGDWSRGVVHYRRLLRRGSRDVVEGRNKREKER